MRQRGSQCLSLADVGRVVAAADSLRRQRRNALLCGLRVAAKLLAQEPHDIAADAELLRRLKCDFSHRDVGVTPARWVQLRTFLRGALVVAGCVEKRPPREFRPGPGWAPICTALKGFAHRGRLMALARYCSAHSIAPGRVDDGVIAAATAWLVARGSITPPARTRYELCLSWNKAVEHLPCWPNRPVAIANRSRRYRLDWAVFPASLKADAVACLDWMSGRRSRRSGRARVISDVSRTSYMEAVRKSATALVRRGHDPARIRTLADLVAVPAVKEILRFQVSRGRDRSTATLYTLVSTLRIIARDWVRVGTEHLAELQAIGKRVGRRRSGLSNRALAQLHAFDDKENVRQLLLLPRKLLEHAEKHDDGAPRKSLLAQSAVAIELLLLCPVQRSQLTKLKLNRDVQLYGQPARIRFPTAGSFGAPLAFELPEKSADLLRKYVERFRPRMIRTRSDWLFPGSSGKAKRHEALGVQISATVRRETGLDVTPRMFRHIGAKLYLERHPFGYEVLRRMLGHRSAKGIQVTYGLLDGPRLHRVFDERVLKIAALSDDRAAGDY